MTGTRTRFLASLATLLGLLAGGFESHVAPQSDGWWHGVTGALSAGEIAGALGASALVWVLGRFTNTGLFLAMSAGLLVFIPALTGAAAGLLLFSAETMQLVFAVLFAACSRDLIERLPIASALTVFAIAFAFFVLVGRYLPGPAGPQGDEPHYLLIAESLLQDGDVDLLNQFENRDYLKFTSGSLEPHTAPRSPKGHLYAIHTPGLSVLVAQGYALLGFTGARAVVSLLMALVVSLLYLAAREWFGVASATFVFLLATFASPLPIYANSLFPDSAATLAVAATLAWLASPQRARLGLAALSIAFLPWLHPRFLPLALILAVAIIIRQSPSWRRAAAVLLPLVAALGLLLFHFHQLFGRASLSAAYGPGFSSDVSILRIPWGASALILDRQFGLVLFAPVLLFGLPGMARLWPRERTATGALIAVSLVTLAIGGSFSMWWGGASAPARFLIAAVPALIISCGAAWTDSSRSDRRSLIACGAGFGLGLLWLACLAPRALHNRADGESGLLRLLTPVLDADRFFPGFVSNAAFDWKMAAWVAVLAAVIIRPKHGTLLLAPLMAAATIASPKPLLDPFASSLRALESWNDHRKTFGGLDRDDAFVLDIHLGSPAWDLRPGSTRFSPRFSLPPGSWTMRVSATSEANPEGVLNVGRVAVVDDDETSPPRVSAMIRVGEPVATEIFAIGAIERRLHIRADGLQARTTVLQVRLSPTPHR